MAASHEPATTKLHVLCAAGRSSQNQHVHDNNAHAPTFLSPFFDER